MQFSDIGRCTAASTARSSAAEPHTVPLQDFFRAVIEHLGVFSSWRAPRFAVGTPRGIQQHDFRSVVRTFAWLWPNRQSLRTVHLEVRVIGQTRPGLHPGVRALAAVFF
jgi:hypothetical protein